MRLPADRASPNDESDMERLTKMELAYLHREKLAIFKTLAEINERENELLVV